MNLPEPSGSSPPEKPPGMKIIWLLSAALAKALTEALMSALERFLTTKISASPPAASTALAESNSQLVPGNTGISTLGLAHFTAGAAIMPPS